MEYPLNISDCWIAVSHDLEPKEYTKPILDDNVFVWINHSLVGVSDYDLLPEKLKDYTRFIEDTVGLSVNILSSGPGREETIQR